MGSGQNILINRDAWIPNASNFKLSTAVSSMQNKIVDILIDPNNRRWKYELVRNTFQENDEAHILHIPLTQSTQDDMLVWREESSGMFSVRNAYKLLQLMKQIPTAYALQPIYKKFYKSL